MLTFDSPGAFAAHLRRVLANLPATDKAALELAGAMIRDETKAVLGQYQTSHTGPFLPWAPLAQLTREERVAQGYPANEPLLRSGILRANIEMSADQQMAVIGVPDREVQHPYSDMPVNIGEVAVDLEFGTKHMEPRSFLGLTMFRFGEAAAALIGSVEAANLAGLAPLRWTVLPGVRLPTAAE